MKTRFALLLVAFLTLVTLGIQGQQTADAQCRRIGGQGYVVRPVYNGGYYRPVGPRTTTVVTPSGYGGYSGGGLSSPTYPSQTTTLMPNSRANVFTPQTQVVQPAAPVYYAPVYQYPAYPVQGTTTIINGNGATTTYTNEGYINGGGTYSQTQVGW